MRLLAFQKRFIREIYDNPNGTSRAYLSIGRKNGKSALIACLVLAHVVGPEARMNSQIISGARSRDQAALVFKLAQKMIYLSPDLKKLTHVTPSQKQITGKVMNVEYRAISADAGTAHGLSPVLAILDEVGQVKGPHDDFIEAITTSQGAHENPLLIAISTQAATDNDLFSRWLDDARNSGDPRIVSHVYCAPDECDVLDRDAWLAANPAMGEFRSVSDLEDLAARAARLPVEEASFRWLYLNQRIEGVAPFISRSVWAANAGEVLEDWSGLPVYAGLDLSSVSDLTALVLVAPHEGIWHVRPVFWLPAEGLREKALKDRVSYDLWARDGLLETTPGKSVEYAFVAEYLRGLFDDFDIRKVAFDRWGMRHLKPWLTKAGFSEEELERFIDFGQGFKDMTPALRTTEALLLEEKIRHGGHAVLEMCARNAVVQMDPAGGRKLAKHKSRGRIDGMVALAMGLSVAADAEPVADGGSYLETHDLAVL